eukprot:6192046-Alexandrium_andersonii.AAC.2
MVPAMASKRQLADARPCTMLMLASWKALQGFRHSSRLSFQHSVETPCAAEAGTRSEAHRRTPISTVSELFAPPVSQHV